jgi:hypothetical protein
MHEAKEVLDVVFPSGHEAAEVVQPCEQPLHFPASAVTTQVAAILAFAPIAPLGRDQLDPVLFGEFGIEWVRVGGFVADDPGWELVEEAAGQNIFHKLALGRRRAVDRYGDRKTVTSGDSDDLRAFTTTVGAEREAPFLAPAKVAPTNASSRFSFPRSCKRRGQAV